jgi:hypothetical protein
LESLPTKSGNYSGKCNISYPKKTRVLFNAWVYYIRGVDNTRRVYLVQLENRGVYLLQYVTFKDTEIHRMQTDYCKSMAEGGG